MLADIRGSIKKGVYFLLFIALSGCAVVGGMMADKSQVVIDESTVDPQLRGYLPTVSRLAFMSQEPTAVYAAEHMEMNSDYLVSIIAPPEATSPSQAKRYMREICDGRERPQVVFYFQSPSSDAGTGTTVKGVLTGRAQYDLNLVTDVLRCDNGWRSQFVTTGEMDQGVYNVDQTKINQILGQKFAIALLRLAGKATPTT